MIAVLFAASEIANMQILGERYSSSMLPLIDRPFIQHIVEYLANQEITDFNIVLSHLPEKTKDLLGNGTRWGIDIHYHLARNPERPYKILKLLSENNKNETILIAHADRLPEINLKQKIQMPAEDLPVLYCPKESAASEIGHAWSGWALVSASMLKDIPEDADEKRLFEYLMSLKNSNNNFQTVSNLLSSQSCKSILSSQKKVLEKKFKGLMISGNEVENCIWISRNVILHPTALVIPPVYIGENCHIGKRVDLGPNVVVGDDCVLDKSSVVSDTFIFPKSYIGEALELKDSIVDRNCLVNVRLDSEINVTDEFLIGSLSEKTFSEWLNIVISRSIACILIFLFFPLLLCTSLFLVVKRRGPLVYKKKVVRLPTLTDSPSWRTFFMLSFCPEEKKEIKRHKKVGWRIFFLQFLPALFNVAKGDLRFVGVTPRSPDEIKTLFRDWKSLYLNSKAGIITEAMVNFGLRPTEDEHYSADAFYSVSAGLRYDFKILRKFFGQLLGVLPKQ